MRILIADDDAVSRKLLLAHLSPYGPCDLTVDGVETLDAFSLALEEGSPYDLICLDIMMPKIDGITVLKTIRDIEDKKDIGADTRSKIIVITALTELPELRQSSEASYEAYIPKPIDYKLLVETVNSFR